MSLMPAFKIGVWNAWILQVIFFIVLSAPSFLMSKEAKESNDRATESMPLSKAKKMAALSTHAVIYPLTVIYSIFLPLKIGTVWLYVGLPIFILAPVMTIITSINFTNTPLDKPVSEGIYRISRNPIYLSGFVLYLGMGLACASWVLILCGVLWLVMLGIVVPDEERFLLDKYGDAYREYMNRTPRWIGLPKGESKRGKAPIKKDFVGEV
jgi:protein-S-isoprenylcysteine O-methyltransferase Ste14